MKLAIISHTEHYKTNDGTIVGWSPTVNEINHLLEVFDEIFHIAMLHDEKPPPSVMPYISDKIIFIPIPVVGGNTFLTKLNIIWNVPKITRTVSKILKQVDYFQLRTPTGIGVFLIPYLTFFSKKKGWFKYAGNWNQKNPPLGYRWQRWILKHQHRKVTINGLWPNQPKNVIAFENPCLDEGDRQLGKIIVKEKKLSNKINFCFVGGLNKNKGVDKIIEAFKTLNNSSLGTLHIIGNGSLRESLEKEALKIKTQVIFHGFLPKNKITTIYKESHFIILPSQSEGFPKVIGEAMNYGCIPIVSEVSCINQYIQNNYNGFLINPVMVEAVKKSLLQSLEITSKEFAKYIAINYRLAERFTFIHYLQRILNEVFEK